MPKNLSFDADGNGAGSSIDIAQLRRGLAFGNANIIVFGGA
ncbi:hypothetical protein [Geminocystis herdmanii]|nr:hypothetical protein [Geminocystis herdmanii]